MRGVHPNLYGGLMTFIKYIGGDDYLSPKKVEEHFESIGVKSVILDSSKTTELLKILSTTYYGWNIYFTKYVSDECNKYGVDYNQVYSYFMFNV